MSTGGMPGPGDTTDAVAEALGLTWGAPEETSVPTPAQAAPASAGPQTAGQPASQPTTAPAQPSQAAGSTDPALLEEVRQLRQDIAAETALLTEVKGLLTSVPALVEQLQAATSGLEDALPKAEEVKKLAEEIAKIISQGADDSERLAKSTAQSRGNLEAHTEQLGVQNRELGKMLSNVVGMVRASDDAKTGANLLDRTIRELTTELDALRGRLANDPFVHPD